MNRDKLNAILLFSVLTIDIVYIIMYSTSLILNIVISLWVLVMIPNILVYIRGNGEWKCHQHKAKVIIK